MYLRFRTHYATQSGNLERNNITRNPAVTIHMEKQKAANLNFVTREKTHFESDIG